MTLPRNFQPCGQLICLWLLLILIRGIWVFRSDCRLNDCFYECIFEFFPTCWFIKPCIFVFAGKQFNMSDVHGCLFLGAEMLSSYDLECYSFMRFFLRWDHPVLHTCLQERLSNIILLYPICEYTKYRVMSPDKNRTRTCKKLMPQLEIWWHFLPSFYLRNVNLR